MTYGTLGSVGAQFRNRAGIDRPVAPVAAVTTVAEQAEEERPDKSWKKADILDWLVDGGIDPGDLVGLTKGELLALSE